MKGFLTVLNIFKRLGATLGLLVILAAPVIFPSLVNAQSLPPDIQESLCQGTSLDITTPSGCGDTFFAAEGFQGLITSIINILSLIVGVIAVIFIIIGGLKYITSGGDSNNVTSAKNTILYAIVGLIIVALAQIVVRFVLSSATQA